MTKGLGDGGHSHTVVDLYADGFDPVFTLDDATQFLHESLPEELLEEANPREVVLSAAKGPVRRYLAKRWLRGKGDREIAKAISERRPADICRHQALVAEADGLVFVAPVFWMSFPAVLRGWFERVFAYGFAYLLHRGVKQAHHTYFYAALAAGDEKRREYLEEAYRLGKEL